MIRLTLGRMFEATVRDCSHELVLEQKVAKSGRVNADVAALLVACSITSGQTALGCSCSAVGRSFRGLDLFIVVIDEIFLVRHDESGVESKDGCGGGLVECLSQRRPN